MENIEIKNYTGKEIDSDTELLNSILTIDKSNMLSIMEKAGVENFPWDKRLAGLKNPETKIFVAFKNKELVGYFEYCPDWGDPQDRYLSSIQIDKRYQGSLVFKSLVKNAFQELVKESFRFIKSGVQVSNHRMIKIFKRLGFEVVEGKNKHSKIVQGTISELNNNKIFQRLMK